MSIAVLRTYLSKRKEEMSNRKAKRGQKILLEETFCESLPEDTNGHNGEISNDECKEQLQEVGEVSEGMAKKVDVEKRQLKPAKVLEVLQIILSLIVNTHPVPQYGNYKY